MIAQISKTYKFRVYPMAGGKEVRRLKAVAHAPCCGSDSRKWLAEVAEWRTECEADSDVLRLVSSNAGIQPSERSEDRLE